MVKLEDLLWGNEESGQNEEPEISVTAIDINCIMICCSTVCGTCGVPISTIGC